MGKAIFTMHQATLDLTELCIRGSVINRTNKLVVVEVSLCDAFDWIFSDQMNYGHKIAWEK